MIIFLFLSGSVDNQSDHEVGQCRRKLALIKLKFSVDNHLYECNDSS